MRVIYTILASLCFGQVFGQEKPIIDGDIKVEKIYHYCIRNKNNEPTKRFTNKANRPYLVYYIDTLGHINYKVGYGEYHNRDLRIIGFVESNTFSEGKLVSTTSYRSDYENDIYPAYKTQYFYNSNNQLIEEVKLYYETDSLSMKFNYLYDKNDNKIETIFSDSTIYHRTYNEESKITSLKLIYKGNTWWEWRYTYTDTARIGIFKTSYGDGKDYTKQEIKRYRNGQLLESTEKYIDEDGLSEKTVFYYDKSGLLHKIDYFIQSDSGDYEKERFFEIKIATKKNLTNELIETINEIVMFH